MPRRPKVFAQRAGSHSSATAADHNQNGAFSRPAIPGVITIGFAAARSRAGSISSGCADSRPAERSRAHQVHVATTELCGRRLQSQGTASAPTGPALRHQWRSANHHALPVRAPSGTIAPASVPTRGHRWCGNASGRAPGTNVCDRSRGVRTIRGIPGHHLVDRMSPLASIGCDASCTPHAHQRAKTTGIRSHRLRMAGRQF